jgi:penicillin G amidase
MNKKSRLIKMIFLTTCMAIIISCALRPMPKYEKNPTLPQVDGTLRVYGLNGEVKVYRDEWGVPHIFTEDKHDLFFASGYVQAQDRLWAIYLFRALATGRLCEMFGDFGIPGQSAMGMQISTLALDRRNRVMGMKHVGEAGEALLAETQPETLAVMESFCDGVNAYVEQNRDQLPVEFQVLYYDPPPITPADLIALSRFYGSLVCASLEEELTRYALIEKLGEDTAWKIMPLHDSLGPTVVPKEMLHNRLSEPRPLPPDGKSGLPVTALSADAAVMIANLDKAVRKTSRFPDGNASNNWVVGPKVTATGTAMLANDPHMPHIQPSLCYLMHIKGAGYDTYGVVYPGLPYIVMGHNRKLSWGATTSHGDVQDIFVETVNPDNPGQYLYKGEWKDFIVREEVIRIRPGLLQTGPDRRFKEKIIKVRHSIHGHIINDMVPDLPEDAPPLAMRWTGWDFSRDPEVFDILISSQTTEDFISSLKREGFDYDKVISVAIMYDTWMRGEGIDDFIKGMRHNTLLNMNWVAADADGHIAYLPGGLLPDRKKGIGIVPSPGESGEYDWRGFVPLMEHPQAIDPERGWMVSANNEVVDSEWYPYTFGSNYHQGWRAWRVEELIEELKPITVDDMRRIQNDVYVKEAEVFVPLILKAVDEKGVTDKRTLQAANILREWDYEAGIDSVGASIYFDTMHYIVDHVLKDDFNKKDYKLVKAHSYNSVRMWIIRGETEFMDNKKTTNKVEDVGDALVASLEDAIKWLTKVLGKDMEQWRWGKIHTIKWYNPMGFGPLKEMSIGPLPHPGADTTVRNALVMDMGFANKRYMTILGPVLRHIIDMGDPDSALLVIDGSQSGQWLSPHYRDMHSLWYNSGYLVAEKRPEKIIDSAESELTLVPIR